MSTLPISVTLLVKNAEKYLDACLSALQDFAEIIVLDNGSTDSTLDIATKFPNVKIHYHDFIGFGPMKNLAESLASNDWILNIDSDEILSQALVEELKSLDLSNKNKVYSFLRINHYRGKPIKTCGWYPDYVSRLYHRTLVKFNDKQVHESLVIPKRVDVVRLKHSFTHYSFDGATSLINKMQQYTSLFAEQQQFRKRTTVLSAVTHGIFSFIKHYFIKRGILSGADGFVISFANACGSYYKYVKLAEANQRLTTSLIITTYNRPDALEAVLHSVLYQTELPDEVIVADDGSTGETSAVIQRLQKDFPVPLIHSWQEDKGFRAAQSRNKALSLAKYDYVILIDGDMLLHKAFIQDHKLSAQKKVLVQGGRIILPPEKTNKILGEPSKNWSFNCFSKGIETRVEKRFLAIHSLFLSKILLQKQKSNEYKGIKSCNMAFFREDALAINGFNNDFVGWGREDSEFVARFFNHGGKRANIKFAAIAYHLWHNEAARDALPENDKLLNDAMEQKLTWCENGVDKFLE